MASAAVIELVKRSETLFPLRCDNNNKYPWVMDCCLDKTFEDITLDPGELFFFFFFLNHFPTFQTMDDKR